jgi:hypothetical protein
MTGLEANRPSGNAKLLSPGVWWYSKMCADTSTTIALALDTEALGLCTDQLLLLREHGSMPFGVRLHERQQHLARVTKQPIRRAADFQSE